MIDVIKPYPDYKDSGLPWASKIPTHWKVRRAKDLFRCINVRSKTGTEERLTVSAERGVVPRSSMKVTMFEAKSYIGHKLCWPYDLVINSLWAWGRGLGVARHHGLVSSAYGVYRLKPEFEEYAPFIHHLVRSKAYHWELRTRSKGVWISRLQLTDDAFLRAPVLVPSVEESKAIARFIRNIDHKINAFIRNRRRLIEVLNEQKQAIINRAVTRGLDPNVPLKPSGIDWLGDIPEHWEARRIKQVTKLVRGKFTHRPRNDPSLYDGPFPFIQTGDVSRAVKKVTSYRQTLNDKGFAVSKQFPAGTLCMTIAANIGDVAILDFQACFPDSIIGFVPTKVLSTEYFYYSMRVMKPQFVRIAPVTAQGNLNVERVGALSFALPPVYEQQAITEHIVEATRSMDESIATATREIDLIHEYRTRLIADVVTGKIDVRHLSPPPGSEDLEEMVEDLEPLDDAAGELDEDALSGEAAHTND